MKTFKETDIKNLQRSLRKAWMLYDRNRKICLNRALHVSGFYVCEVCAAFEEKVYVDHIYPVVDPIHGWQGEPEYARRLFVPADDLQAICKKCHGRKTKGENAMRRKAKEKK